MRRRAAASWAAGLSISIHAPLAGCDLYCVVIVFHLVISIHAPLAGCDARERYSRAHRDDFNPRTPCGVRPALPSIGGPPCRNFNPRTPCGVRLVCGFICHNIVKFQSTHPLRGATFCICRAFARSTFQSTHPLRGATIPVRMVKKESKISIHAPLAGCDARLRYQHSRESKFQSTHPLRGATQPRAVGQARLDFNPRTPCGVRHPAGKVIRFTHFISIHAPLAGCDEAAKAEQAQQAISIHAPLAGCDRGQQGAGQPLKNFNPRTPCGVRRGSLLAANGGRAAFQSTHPLRGATADCMRQLGAIGISIHAPLAGCDEHERQIEDVADVFQSTHPLRGATFRTKKAPSRLIFQSTHPLRGATRPRR